MRIPPWLGLAAALCACSEPSPAGKEEMMQVMETFTMTQSAAGAKTWQLNGPRARISPSGDAQVSRPVVFFYRDGKQSNQATSREAFVHGGSNNVTMLGDVVVVSAKDNSRLKTERLEYLAKTRRFHTEEAVTVERSGTVTHGKGMDADSELSEINIFHQETVLR